MRGQMNRFGKCLLLGLGAIILSNISASAFMSSPNLEKYSTMLLPSAEGKSGEVRVTFLGVSTLLFDDGDTAFLTDGFFTRPRKLQILFGLLKPNSALIDEYLQRIGVKKLAAVVVTHTHFDHALDSAEIAKRTGAVLIGSRSAANLGRGAGLPEDRIRVVQSGEEFDLGRFHLTMVKSKHSPWGFAPGEIRHVLAPPAWVGHYNEGGTYTLIVKHDDQRMLVQSSAGYAEAALKGQKADVVFLGIGLLGKQRRHFREGYWRNLVQETGARRVVLIHWDDFTRPLSEPLVPAPKPFDYFEKSMTFLIEKGKQNNVDMKLPSAWQKIDPFAGL